MEEKIREKARHSVKRVLLAEADEITKLADSFEDSVIGMIDTINECTGKVILTGMGKSGHVAQKISATLASLGTPSFFLHPAEAAHGDLGMIQQNDVVVMLSKSGETDELVQLINTIKVIGSKLIGMFCRRGSTLERFCNITVIVPVEHEACSIDLAPTSSTTAMMALGDAVAVALSEINGFAEKDFALFHPKGSLGKKLLVTVGSLIHTELPDVSVTKETSIEDVLWLITKNRMGAAAVVSADGKLEGLITDGDIRRSYKKNENIFNLSVMEIMTTHPYYVHPDMLAIDAFYFLQNKKISIVPVANDDNILIGLINMHDIIGAGING